MNLFGRQSSSGGSAETVDVAAARKRREADKPPAPRNEEAVAERPAASQVDPTETAFGTPKSEPTPRVRRSPIRVIRVNADEITVEEVLEPILDELRVAAQTQSVDFYRRLVQERVGLQWRRRLERLLVYQEAIKEVEEEHLERLDKHAEKLFKKYVDEEFDGVERKFEVYAEARNWSREKEIERRRREAVVSMWVHDRFRPRVDLTRAELKKMYDEQIDRFTTPERRSMMLIDLPYAKFLGPAARPTAKDWAAARQLTHAALDRIREELASGVDFRAVAMQYSKGPNAGAGGVWESIRPGSLRPRYKKPTDALFSLAEGQVSEPVEADEGLFLVKCTRIEPQRRVPFADAQAEMREKVAERKRNEALGKHLQKLVEQATVDRTEVIQFLTAVEQAAPPHKSRTAQAKPATRP